jgi:hypothetical protein
MEHDFVYVIKNNKYVHSAFCMHKNYKLLINKVLDENNNLKPFYKFYRDIEELVIGYNKNLLEKEYDMLIIKAHREVDWYRFKQYKDILPNLLWEPSTHPEGCRNHEKYWGRIWRVSDAFWKKHKPGDCMDCQCYLCATDDPVTDNTDLI